MISNSEEIKDSIQILDILGQFISLKKKGVNFTSPCPFHTEKTPSFLVNPGKGTYKCFGCGKSGDAIDFLRENEAMSYAEALTFIANFYGIPIKLSGNDAEYSETEKRRDGIFASLKWAAEYFRSNLQKNAPALAYLKKRQLELAVGTFQIGYADTGNDLMRSAQAAGYSTEVLFAAGLVK